MPNGARLSEAEIGQFVQDGYVRIEGAFARADADAGRAILWRDTGCDPDDPITWTLGHYGQEPFARAANTRVLHQAFDRLVGPGRWHPRPNLGTFPIRFPSSDDPGDAGWHIDVSFGTEAPDFLDWRANARDPTRATQRARPNARDPTRATQRARQGEVPFGYFAHAGVDRLVAGQSVTPDPARRRELVQKANLLTSDKVAAMFVFHPVSPLVSQARSCRKEVNYPAESRIPDLVDLDLVTVEI